MGALSTARSTDEFHQLKGQVDAYADILRWLNITEAESLGHTEQSGDNNE